MTRTIEYIARGPLVAVAQQTRGWTGTLVRGVLNVPGIRLALCTGVDATTRCDDGDVAVRVCFRAIEAYWRWVYPATGRLVRFPVARVYGWGEFPWWMQTAIRRKFARWEDGDAEG